MRLLALAFLLSQLVCIQVARAAETPAADYLAPGHATWEVDPGYKVSHADGVATLHVDKQVMWAGQKLTLTTPCDISAHPDLSVQVRTTAPMILDLYLSDGKSFINIPRRIRAVGDFQTYGVSFAGVKDLDAHHITTVLFCVNGGATSWSGTVELKQLELGAALPQPGIEAVEDQEWYHDTGAHAALLTGIDHVTAFTLTGVEQLLTKVAFSPIADGHCTMSYALIPGATGKATARLQATGADGYASTARTFTVLVEDNLPPTIDTHPPVTAVVGKPLTIRFTGVSDGNFTADQPLTITLASSNPAVVATQELTATNPNDGRYLYVVGTPKAPGDALIKVVLDDKSGKISSATTTVTLHAVAQWNNPPTLDPVVAQRGYISGGDQVVPLTGIGDGDGGSQHLTLTATSSEPSIIPAPTVDYSNGATASLHFAPTATGGVSTITVTVTDDGGRADNNGNQSISQSFAITTRARPVTSYTMKADEASIHQQLRAEDGIVPSADKDGDAQVIKVACKDKSTFGGLWLALPDMDLAQAPYLTVDVKCDQKIAFNMYFYDSASARNDGATRTQTIGGPSTPWQTVTFDFSGNGQMSDGKSKPIDSKCISAALFNFHPSLTWPFSNWTGTLYFRNMRIGLAADIPKRAPVVAVAPVPALVLTQGSGIAHVTLSGITVANHKDITLAVSETGTTKVSPVLGAIQDGIAVLSLTAGQAGRSTVTVVASAAGADPTTLTVTVDVVDPGGASKLGIDATKTFQTIRGFGTFFGPDVDLYTKVLGASAVRVGCECEFNPRKDTSDINVLNRDRLNYKTFDFDYMRKLKAAGVETFFFTAWSPPAWEKTNFSTNFQQAAAFWSSDACPNRLDYDQYDDYAKTMVSLVRMFQEEAGITFDAISLQNEPSFCENYGSAILDPARMVHLIDVVGPRFEKEGIPTKFLMPEQVFGQANMLEYIRVLNADPVAQKYCNIIATHGYDDKGVKAMSPDFPAWNAMFKLAQQGGTAKELWMSETEPDYANWKSAMDYSLMLYGSLEYGNISLWTQWGIEGTLLNHNLPNDSFWVVRQYYKFIRPGAKRVASTSADASVFATSYLNDQKHGGRLVSIITNPKDVSVVEQLTVTGHEVASWQVVTTDPIRHGVTVGTVKAGEPLLLQPNSVTTVIEE